MKLIPVISKALLTLSLTCLISLSAFTYVQAEILQTVTKPIVKPINYLFSELPKFSRVYDEKSDPFADASNALALAKQTNRQVLIEIGGNWCTWCHKMDVFLEKNPEVFQTLHSKYVLLKVSVSDSNENSAFMESLPPVLGYPHMYVSTAEGKMLLSKDTAELLDDGEYSTLHWLTFINKWAKQNTLTASNTQTKAE
jgi:thioredoxin-related protein